MKTYLCDSFNRYKQFSRKINAKTILCNKSWWVFNDNGDKDIYIFQKDGTLIISINGRVCNFTWKYISANQSIVITSAEQSYMVIPVFVDGNILVLQVDGTNEFAFLIDENVLKKLVFKSYNDIIKYFEIKEKENEKEQQIELLNEPEETPLGCYLTILFIGLFILGFIIFASQSF